MRAFDITLGPGRRLRLEPIGPDDRERLRQGFARLSARSRYLRFRRPVGTLGEAELSRLTETDGRDHVAWGAVALEEPGMPGIGVARFVRRPGDSRTADLAVAVVDDWQRRGVGRLLVETLLLAALACGVDRLAARVLRENHGARRLLERLGARMVHEDPLELQYELPVRRRDRLLISSVALREPASAGEQGTVSRQRDLLRLL